MTTQIAQCRALTSTRKRGQRRFSVSSDVDAAAPRNSQIKLRGTYALTLQTLNSLRATDGTVTHPLREIALARRISIRSLVRHLTLLEREKMIVRKQQFFFDIRLPNRITILQMGS